MIADATQRETTANLAAWSGGREERKFGASRDVIDGDRNVAAPCALRGAIVFAARAGQPFVRDAVWLFTRVDFAPGQDDRPMWLPPARSNPAAFLRLCGCFWIVNGAHSANLVQINQRSLAPGEAAPLDTQVSLQLGSREFSTNIE